MVKLSLDSCVWIDYIWQIYFAESIKSKNKTSSTKLIQKISGDKKYEIILSPFLINEISTHFRDWYILQQVIKAGFSYREMNKEKKNFEIREKEREDIDNNIIKIGSIKNVNVLMTEGFTEEEIETILKLETKYYFDFYDAFHVYISLREKCKYFITKDTPLRVSITRLNQDKNNSYNIECLSPSIFSRYY